MWWSLFNPMKKSIFILVFTLFNFLNSHSQDKGAVIYQFKHLRDTTTNIFYEEEMILYFSQTHTSYKSYSGIKQDSSIKMQVEKNFQTGGRMQLGRIKATTKQIYYKDLRSEKAFVESKIGEDIYLYEDTLKPITWQLINQEKNIGGIKCKAAKTKYFGRNYFVWYAVEIPIQGGPWKLYGLPGLILQAIDEKNQISFDFQGFLTSNYSGTELFPPKMAIKTTKQDFMKTLETVRQNPQLANNGLPISITNNPSMRNTPTFNNPIELK
jgi:GLPGLI family protein